MGRTKEITEAAHDRYVAQRLEQTIVLGCNFCGFTTPEGPFGEMRVLAAAHRRDEHPEARQRTTFAKRRAGIRTIGKATIGENIANVRAQGGAAWASDGIDL